MKLGKHLPLLLAVVSTLGWAAFIPHPSSRDIASDIWEEITDATTCATCEAVLLLLKGLAALGDSTLVKTLSSVCGLQSEVDKEVCVGLIQREGPAIAHDLRKMTIGSKTSKLFCITFIGLCDYPAVAPYAIQYPSPKPSTQRPSSSGQTPLQIVQIADIHLDPYYTTGANTQCTKPICCRSYTTADSPSHNTSPAGLFGDHRCDTPYVLANSMYAAIRSVAPNAAFTIFTGDIVDHAVWNTTQAQNTMVIDDAYTGLSSLGLVYGVVGNHEAHPVNLFQPAAVGDDPQWVYDLVARRWTTWIGVTAANEAKEFGAYSVKYPGGNLRIITLNTNFYYTWNLWMYEETMELDPSGQFSWLVGELQAAETAGERVYLLGHTPMGEWDAFHDYSNYFDQIVNRYSTTIAAMFFGHTHRDHFELSYTNYNFRSHLTASAMSYICPSVTPTDGHPAFRIYTVDPVTFAVLDSTTYIANMSNPSFQTSPVWTKYYSAREVYGTLTDPPLTDVHTELSPAFWHNVTNVLESDNTAFVEYLARKSRGWNVESCTGDCKTKEICQMRAARSEDNCYDPEFGFSMGKRGLENVSEIQSERTAEIMRKVVLELVEQKDAVKSLFDGAQEVKRSF